MEHLLKGLLLVVVGLPLFWLLYRRIATKRQDSIPAGASRRPVTAAIILASTREILGELLALIVGILLLLWYSLQALDDFLLRKGRHEPFSASASEVPTYMAPLKAKPGCLLKLLVLSILLLVSLPGLTWAVAVGSYLLLVLGPFTLAFIPAFIPAFIIFLILLNRLLNRLLS